LVCLEVISGGHARKELDTHLGFDLEDHSYKRPETIIEVKTSVGTGQILSLASSGFTEERASSSRPQ
jgi:hypothetical protein